MGGAETSDIYLLGQYRGHLTVDNVVIMAPEALLSSSLDAIKTIGHTKHVTSDKHKHIRTRDDSGKDTEAGEVGRGTGTDK